MNAGTSDKTTGNSSQSQLNPNAFEFTIGNNQVNFPPTHISASGFSNSSQFHKLPKLNMPTFDGNLLNWQSFWDSFSSAVHDNTTLSDVQKFNYLKSQLYGEASQCIAGLQDYKYKLWASDTHFSAEIWTRTQNRKCIYAKLVQFCHHQCRD